jgi:DcuC family C4-dicarboxylate transporter
MTTFSDERFVLLLGVVIISLAIVAVFRRLDVRLVLLAAALALGALGGKPLAVVRVFLSTFSDERFVVPICTAMGFAYVLRYTGCDRHLVHLLLRPVRHVRALLIPGTIAVGFLVNIPVVSQTSTAVTLGAVAIPLLLAARIPPVTVGAALLLGSSIGGELLNPGAPELRTIVEESGRVNPHKPLRSRDVVDRIAPLNFLALGVATAVFCALYARPRSLQANEKRIGEVGQDVTADPSVLRTQTPAAAPQPGPALPPFRVNLLLALIPLLPLALLFLTAPPFSVIQVPADWLVESAVPGRELTPAQRGLFDSRLIGAAMLVGVLAAALAVWNKGLGVAGAFFDGAGYGFTHIISLIVAARCFAEGVDAIGLADLLGRLIEAVPWLLLPTAGAVSLAFAALCGSGMATTQGLFKFFAQAALPRGVDLELVGAVVSLAAAAGRTMSPVAAVTLMSARLTDTNPLELARRVALPLLAGVVAVVAAAMLMAAGGWPG